MHNVRSLLEFEHLKNILVIIGSKSNSYISISTYTLLWMSDSSKLATRLLYCTRISLLSQMANVMELETYLLPLVLIVSSDNCTKLKWRMGNAWRIV